MSRPPMVLTGPQAVGIAAAALFAWSVRAPLCHLGRLLYWGPDFLWDDDDPDDYVDFVGANPDLHLGPIPTKE